MKKIKIIITALMCCLLSGCGLAQMQEQQRQLAAQQAYFSRLYNECDRNNKRFVARETCSINVAKQDPSTLSDDKQEAITYDEVLVEKVRAHKMTDKEAKLALLEKLNEIRARERSEATQNASLNLQRQQQSQNALQQQIFQQQQINQNFLQNAMPRQAPSIHCTTTSYIPGMANTDCQQQVQPDYQMLLMPH